VTLSVIYGHAAIPVAIGDIDVSVRSIDGDARWKIKQFMAGIHWGAVNGAVGGIKMPLGANLEQQFAPIVRVFLYNRVFVARNPHVSLIVDRTAMQLPGKYVSISPGITTAPFCRTR